MPPNDRLFDLLNELTDEELLAIWTKALRCKPEDDFVQAPHAWRVDCISREWRAAHGHTLRNVIRKPHELPWKRILIDVADKLNPDLGWTSFSMSDAVTEREVERAILRMYDEKVRRVWNKLKYDEKERLANALDEQLKETEKDMMTSSRVIAARSVTVASLGSGISAGLMSGAGALAIAQGATGFIASGLVGGVVSQVGLWIIVRVFGFWSGVQMAAGGGLATVGGAVLSAPAALGFLAHAVMATSYRKSIPATLMLLAFHEARRQIELAADET